MEYNEDALKLSSLVKFFLNTSFPSNIRLAFISKETEILYSNIFPEMLLLDIFVSFFASINNDKPPSFDLLIIFESFWAILLFPDISTVLILLDNESFLKRG